VDVVRRGPPAPGILIEEGAGVLQVGWVEVPRAEAGASGEGDLEQIGGGASQDGVAEAKPPCPLEQIAVGSAEEVPGRA